MAKKRITLPKDFEEIMERNDISELAKVYETCDINAYERDWMKTPALCMYGISKEFIDWLVAHEADINAKNVYGDTPLMRQASINQTEKVRLLLQLGADIHAKNRYQRTALHYAEAPETIEILLKNGADPRAKNDMNETPLIQRLMECRTFDIVRMAKVAKLFIGAGDEVNEEMRERVRAIGHEFESSRTDLPPETLQKCEESMKELYTLFDVEPVPACRKHNGKEPITVLATDWGARFNELWDFLVPSEGHAKTVQGEVIRICGKVAHEIIDNGACNWSRDYRKLPQALPAYFAMGNPIPATDFSLSPTSSQQQDENEELTDLAKSIHAGSTEDDFNRLQELAVKWVLANPMPIKLGKVGYRR